MTLDMLKIGEEGVIASVNEMDEDKSLRNHLLDMGLIPRTRVMVRKVAPMGDPIEIHLRGYELTLRLDEARQIEVVPTKEEKQ